MVQPLKPVTASPLYANNSVNFGNKKSEANTSFGQQRPSKAAAVAKFAATEFVAGAAVSAIFDTGINLWRKFVSKKHAPIPLKSFPGRAAFMGVMFLLIGTVFSGISSMMNKK